MRKSIKSQILLLSIVPTMIVGLAVLITSVLFLKQGMEEEVLKGLLSSAYAYKDVGITVTDRAAGDSAIESKLKKETGYDFTWFDNDTRKNSSLGESVIGTKAADTVIDAVIKKGQPFTSTNTQVVNKAYFVAYVPVKDDAGNVVSMAFTGVSRDSVNKHIMHSIITIICIGLVINALTGLVIYKLASNMADAIKTLNNGIDNLANGKFISIDKHLYRQDEIGKALNSTNSLVVVLNDVISHIKESSVTLQQSSTNLETMANDLSETSGAVSNAVEDIAHGAVEQAESIQSAVDNVTEIDTAVGNVVTATDLLTETAQEMTANSKNSEQALMKLENSFNTMTENISTIVNAVGETSNAVDTVNDKIESINAIASQTNLLALNASIEAARAGEQGRGFSVVATEIGKLAADSNNTANEIKKEMINLLSVTHDVNEKAMEMQDIAGQVTGVLRDVVELIRDLITHITTTVENIDSISEEARTCMSAKDVVTDAMSALSAISEENAASTEETSASVIELSASVESLSEAANNLLQLASALENDVSFFE